MSRELRLRELKDRIERGEYRVDAEAVAAAIVGRISVPDLPAAAPALVPRVAVGAAEREPVTALAA